ncbi:MAG: HPP family protein [Spongiibacteraceae bacterium]|nr:HPP family protein [Spongiibacteraceae bacterium]
MGLRQFMGFQARSSLDEKVISGLGAFLGILSVFIFTDWATDFELAISLLPSMGASAVLVLAVPHGTLSQPWPLLGGNLISALVGVTCASYIDNMYLAAGTAVGLSIMAMHLLRCIHPPGGATALIAVVGGEAIRDLGFSYIVLPTLANCLVIFTIAMAFNNLFPWRRYPSSLMRYDNSMYSPETSRIKVSHLQLAMETLDEVIDIAPEQVKYIVDKADEIMRSENAPAFKIVAGGYYTNGAPGQAWAVRQVIDISNHPNPSKKRVIYRTVDGAQKGSSATVLLFEFSDWAREVMTPAATKLRIDNKRDAA